MEDGQQAATERAPRRRRFPRRAGGGGASPRWNVLASLFSRPRSEEFLARYVVRECTRGRALADVLQDRYVLNRSTAEERARLLDRPEVVEAIGQHVIAEMRASGR